MFPKLDYNVCHEKTTRYRRTHPAEDIRETEKVLNELYSGYRTILCNSGMEAVNTAFDLIRPKTVIVDDETYFETRHYLSYRGTCRVVQIHDLNDRDALEKALILAEAPCVVCGDNPTTFGTWKDVEHISRLAHEYGAYVMIDNSIVSLHGYNPIREGADICAESYTKYVCGHGDVFAGGIALSNSMKWLDDVPVPVPCPGMKSIDWILSRRGNVPDHRAAYMVRRGLETLPIRMERHTRSAHQIFDWLLDHGVEALYCGKGGLITLPGKGEEFCRLLKKFKTIGTFGCTYSNADFFRSGDNYTAGVCARLSVGLENPEELLEDVQQAIEKEEHR